MRTMRSLALLIAVCVCGCVDGDAKVIGLIADAGGLDLGVADVGRDASAVVSVDASVGAAADTSTGDDASTTVAPNSYAPCETELCWSSLSIGARCGQTTLTENFSSGRYNVHAVTVDVSRGVDTEIQLRRTGGGFQPALIVHDEAGETVWDGERGVVTAEFSAELLDSGRGSDTAHLTVRSESDRRLLVFVTAWQVVDGGFESPMPTDATYSLTVVADCEAPDGLLSPPNFDEGNIANGYYLLPDSSPSGLYTRKADDCSRGTRLLIDVIYTVASRWNMMRPEYSPITIRDMNEGSCSTVDHATHDDGTHVDLRAGCATEVACADTAPAIELAQLFADTGEVCGIIFNDTAVQAALNAYFDANHMYEPWFGTFMRSVGSHVVHFHVRVKKPDGTCN